MSKSFHIGAIPAEGPDEPGLTARIEQDYTAHREDIIGNVPEARKLYGHYNSWALTANVLSGFFQDSSITRDQFAIMAAMCYVELARREHEGSNGKP